MLSCERMKSTSLRFTFIPGRRDTRRTGCVLIFDSRMFIASCVFPGDSCMMVIKSASALLVARQRSLLIPSA